MGKFDHALTVLPNPGIMVKKGNHSQMAQEFRLGKYYNLPKYMGYTHVSWDIIHYVWTIIRVSWNIRIFSCFMIGQDGIRIQLYIG
jgi:hypothetical protein